MKKVMFLIFGAVCILIASCSKDSGFGPGSDLSPTLSKGYPAHGTVIVVPPDKDGENDGDTDDLLAAFEEAKAAGPGSVVKLVAGTYRIAPIEVRDYYGSFCGAGMGKTVITNLPNIPCNDYWDVDNCPYLMQFVNADLNISDMTFHIADGCACDGTQDWSDYFGDLLVTVLVLADYTNIYRPADAHINAVVKNVEFISGVICPGGVNPLGMEGNVNMSLYCGTPMMSGTGNDPLSNGNITVTGCRFIDVVVGPDFAGFGKNSEIKVVNNFISGNGYGMFMYANLGSRMFLSNNRIQGASLYGIFIDDFDYGFYPDATLQKRTEWNISGNYVQSASGATGVFLNDGRRVYKPDEGFPQLITVKGNVIRTGDGGMALLGLNNVGAKILNNKFTGEGSVGIMIDGTEDPETWAEYGNIIGNNIIGASYTDASVYLGPFTRYCKVVGVQTDKVVDMGQNNTVIGVKASKSGIHYNLKLHNRFRPRP